MREAMGGGIEIMIDVNMGWDADTAIQAGHRIDEFDPYWLEEPVVAEDFAGYRRIAAALKTVIVGGESHFTRNDLRPFFETPCVPILQPDRCAAATPSCARSRPPPSLGHPHRPHLFHETMVHVLARSPTPTTSNTWTGTTISGSSRCCRRRRHDIAGIGGHGYSSPFRPEILKVAGLVGQRMT